MLPIPRAALAVPRPREHHIERSRLRSVFDQAARRPLILVVAPAGYGKTTALADWVSARNHRVAWWSLEEPDEAPERFAYGLAASLATAFDLVSSVAELSGAVHDVESAKDAIARTLAMVPVGATRPAAQTSAGGNLLVLDDVHRLGAEGLQLVESVIGGAPAGLAVVLASRHDPGIQLARRRLAGDVADVRAAELAFTPEETAGLLARHIGPVLDEDTVDGLVKTTSGWAAGLQAAGLAAAAADSNTEALSAFARSQRYVFDFLDEEVLNRLEPDSLELITGAAILERFTPDLAAAVAAYTGPRPAAAILGDLERRQLFLERDESGPVPVYRFHALFRELLRQRLARRGRGASADAHRRAAEWFLKAGDASRAVNHAREANDPDFLADVAAEAAEDLLTSRQITPLRAALDDLPAEYVRGRSDLATIRAWLSLGSESVVASETWWDAARHSLPSEGGVLGLWHATGARIAAWRGEVAEAERLAETAAETLPLGSPIRLETRFAVAVAHHMAGHIDTALTHFRRVMAEAEAHRQPMLQSTAGVMVAEALLLQGGLREAGNTALPIAQSEGPNAARARIVMGRIALEQNDLESAERWAASALKSASAGRSVSAFAGRLLIADVLEAQGRRAEADQALEDARILADGHGLDAAVIGVRRTRVGFQLARGDVDAGVRYLAGPDIDPSDSLVADVLLAAGRHTEAIDAFSAQVGEARQSGRRGQLVRSLIGLALARDAAGDRSGARSALAEALDTAEPEGLIRPFLEWPRTADLVADQAKQGRTSPLVARLLAAGSAGQRVGPDDTEALSERELEVLTLVAEGLSNRDVSDALVIAVGTVKRHLTNIYQKLDAASRTEAVHRAQELGLLRRTGSK